MPVALVDTPIAQALGLTLAHFLWEGAAIAALLAVTLLLAPPASARVRYALACAALGAMLASFGATLAILWPAASPVMVPSGPPAALVGGDGAIAFQPDGARSDLSWIVPFWAAGVLIFYMRSAGGWFAAQRLYRKGSIAASPEWQQRLRDLAARLRVTRPAVLLESCLAESPVVIGFLRPAILVPVGLLTGLTPKQLESILLHELAHIRRYDYAVNVMQSLIEGLLFYHPAVWWISGVARTERENCCDDAVVSAVGDARGYAAALAALEELRAAGEPAL
jgi:Zn-dependent protease with chaperone function